MGRTGKAGVILHGCCEQHRLILNGTSLRLVICRNHTLSLIDPARMGFKCVGKLGQLTIMKSRLRPQFRSLMLGNGLIARNSYPKLGI